MFPFWEVALEPVLRASQARRIVEIGALRGENTQQLLDLMGPDAELHVIDPAPVFEPAEHERRFAGRYVFHQDLSVNVLPTLPPMDAALIDGDHNWFTVYHELSMLRDVAAAAGAPLPVLILHDVLWPYGRRDLYYDPETVPTEFRQPYRAAGMRKGKRDLLARGGLNPAMSNAEVEGGPRNGVMTALDDFMAEHERPLRRIVLPIYYGLAIVVEEELLASNPELASVLDELESPATDRRLLELGEDLRLKAMVFQHNVVHSRSEATERLVARYLDTVKGALLDEHHLENEVRLAHLADAAVRGRPPNPEKLRDPARHDKDAFRELKERRRIGEIGGHTTGYPYTAMGRVRLDQLHHALETVITDRIEGDVVECGTGRGGGAMFLKAVLTAREVTDRVTWVVDPFDGSASAIAADARDALTALHADLNTVRDGFARFDLLDDRVRFLQGDPVATLASAEIGAIALLRIGPGLGSSVSQVLSTLHDRVTPGGFIVVEGVDDPACAAEVERFRSDAQVVQPIERIDAATWAWRRHEGDGSAPGGVLEPRTGRSVAPLAPGRPGPRRELSVVIVAYDMRREMARSLHSLTRTYQRGIGDLDYEVIVVENGSPKGGKLDRELVESFGPEFRFLDLGSDATPSPTGALNRGIAASGGDALALMIDGAHVLTPGVLRFGMAGLSTYAPAIVATQQWYVGPGQQGDVMQTGYDQAYEDQLFESIAWPEDGYRLFDVGHFIGIRDWFDGVWESNCLFTPRSLVEQVGGFDDGYSMPGGGYTNLDLYERLGSTPEVTVATIIGEGSFHQVHGGTTTNQSDPEERTARIFGYGEHYRALRGRRFLGPGKPIHYVGGMQTPSARRSKARRMGAKAFSTIQSPAGPDGRPESAVPLPEELRADFIEAYWRTLAWRDTTWLDRPVTTPPTDLVTYQEILYRVRPDIVIDVGTGAGGRALYLASICELMGHGQVISIDPKPGRDQPVHPRITHVTGVAHDDATVAQVRELAGGFASGLVVLGSRGSAQRTRMEFERYCGFVSVGSYVIVEETILNGHPVFPGFGPGPMEGAVRALQAHGDFVADTAMEKQGLTFNPGGYLRRVR